MKQQSKNLKSLEEIVGDSVRKYRADHRLTMVEFSEISGVSSPMISKIERGQVSASLSTLDALARALSIPIANLFASTTERKEVSYVKANSGIETNRVGSTYGHSYQLVGRATSDGNKAECYVITIQDSAAGQPLLMERAIEFIHIL
tara:strand:- start:1560 stop:2000 length:441 start_codon:yes stop_codon:yes gene_type:complete